MNQGMRLLIFLSVITLFPSSSNAQIQAEERSRMSVAAYYNYSDPGDVTIIVHVWGAITYPGLYEIPRNTTLSHLVSLAGGPALGARSRRSKRVLSLRLYRNINGSPQSVVFQEQMENSIAVSEEDPILLAGDILTVESVTRTSFSYRDLFPIIAAVASVSLIVDRLLQ